MQDTNQQAHSDLNTNIVLGYISYFSLFSDSFSVTVTCTLDDSHRTGTSEIVQQLKVFKFHSETYILPVFFINTLFGPYFHFFAVFYNTFN